MRGCYFFVKKLPVNRLSRVSSFKHRTRNELLLAEQGKKWSDAYIKTTVPFRLPRFLK